MKWWIVLWMCLIAGMVSGQMVFKGRYIQARYPGSEATDALSAVHVFATAGPDAQSIGFRTWETDPTGWFCLPGPAGRYTVVFSDPSGFVRPRVLTNQFLADGDVVDLKLSAEFDDWDLSLVGWDDKPASDYFQTFVARGTSITQVGFKLATDGIDGPGPEGQNLLLSIHRKTDGAPDTWPHVGPEGVVLNVDCGGPKNYWWSAGWNSGEVPTIPGQTYAVHLHAQTPNGRFQAFWRPIDNGSPRVFRKGDRGDTGWLNRHLCMTIASDSDGLRIPYNKRIQAKFGEMAGFEWRWSQTWRAQGRSLASVILYAATGGTQPSLMRQRVAIRIRKGGTDGPIVGVEKIAIGNGNYTGDASWGVFGAAFAPGEVELTRGELYAVEFESIENFYTLHGFVNIKGDVSDDRPGFNPYKKHPLDVYEPGRAYRRGIEPQPFDLDLQIVEYENAAADWDRRIESPNLVVNGGMEIVTSDNRGGVELEGWKRFAIEPETGFAQVMEGPETLNPIIRIYGGSSTKNKADGGYAQKVSGLSKNQTYRISARVRSTWPVDEKHACRIGIDPTGQDGDPKAATIEWTLLPGIHGRFVPFQSRPIRPTSEAISVWIVGKTTLTEDYRFEAEFDDVALHKVATGAPR